MACIGFAQCIGHAAEHVRGELLRRRIDRAPQPVHEATHVPVREMAGRKRVPVLQSDEVIARIRSLTHRTFNAPTVLLVCADLAESWKNVDGCDSAEVDAAIALDHMMMEAWEGGVGSTWVRGFDERIMRAAFDLPPTWKVVAMMPMGYPAENARPSSWHFRRKAIEELCQFI